VKVFILKFALQTSLSTAVFHYIAKQRKKSIPKTDVLLIDFLWRGIKNFTEMA
jgi:hypothetical protein